MSETDFYYKLEMIYVLFYAGLFINGLNVVVQRQQASPPSTRMSLRSYRSAAVVPMETSSSSSSDDSCDSFGSDGFGNSV